MKAFVKSSYYILLSNIISKIFGLITLGSVSRSLNNENFGNYSAVQNAAISANMIGSLGVPTVLQMKSANVSTSSKDDLSLVVSNSIMLYVLSNSLVCLLLFTFPGFFNRYLLNSALEPDYNIYLIFILMLSSVNQIPLYFLMGIGAFKEYAKHNLQTNLITLICTILFIYVIEASLKSALSALVFSNLIGVGLVVILFMRIMKKYELTFKLQPDFRQMHQILKTGFILYTGNTLLVAISGFVTISLFYKYLNSADYGYLRIAGAFSMILAVLPGSLQPVNLSKIFTAGDQKNLMSIQFRIIPFLSLLLTILIISNIETLILRIFSKEYLDGTDFIYLMILLQIPIIYLSILSNYITAIGFLTYVGFVSILGTISFMASLHFLIPLSKLDGYFYSSLIATIISLIFAIPKVMQSGYAFNKWDVNSIGLNLFTITALIIIFRYFDTYKNSVTFALAVFHGIVFYYYCLECSVKRQIGKTLNEYFKILWKE